MTELRRPKHAYQGRNGFTESTPAAANATISESLRLAEEAKKRRLAEWVLKEKGTHFPDLEEITRLSAESETTSTIKRRIDELRTQHAMDMENLYAYYTQVYREEQEDLRTASDNSVSEEQDDPALLTESPALHEFYRSNRLSIQYQLECDDAISRIHYSHLQMLLPLQKKLAALSARFPESIDAYHAMNNNKDMQLKVAKFLTAPSNMRDAMLSEFRWAWRQVKPLLGDFERDIDFRTEVQKYVKENEMRDPRKRSSFSKSL